MTEIACVWLAWCMVSRRKREQNKSRGIIEGGGSGPSIHVRDSRKSSALVWRFAEGNI